MGALLPGGLGGPWLFCWFPGWAPLLPGALPPPRLRRLRRRFLGELVSNREPLMSGCVARRAGIGLGRSCVRA